ncbi:MULTISPECIES: formate/nitrite transporter family protein [unclassified Psychrobacter]|uniref:formate/nitrite transporter family protein n=1 Tax=unclassified Psychrobacter TaxID=196806 RepID=UPI000420883A|nr:MULTISPECIES: formate/nitrite transporter family protein [unclassified Psychrobacter]
MPQNNDKSQDLANDTLDSQSQHDIERNSTDSDTVATDKEPLEASEDKVNDDVDGSVKDDANTDKENSSQDVDDSAPSNDITENLSDEDFPEEFTQEEKETIKKVASDDNLSKAKSSASILVEQFIDAKETFGRSLGSLFTSAFTAGLEIGISFFVILSAFALLKGVVPDDYAMVLSSLLYPIGFIIVVIGQSLLFTEQTSLLSLPVLNKIEPLHKLLRLWGIVIAGNVVGGCLFAALMIGLGLNMDLFTVSAINAYAEHVLGFEWWVIFGSAVLAGWMMGIAAWLVTSARDTISRIVLVTLITGSIGFLGLHHSIVGNIEVFAALMYGTTVGILDYLLFLAVVLAGNTVGGVVFVAVLKNRTFLFDVAKVREESAEDKSNKLARLNGRKR